MRGGGHASAFEATAYHEAGHAVVSWRLGLGVFEVTIEPERSDGGSGSILYLGRAALGLTEAQVDSEAFRYKDATRALAGSPAGRKFTKTEARTNNDDPSCLGSDAWVATPCLMSFNDPVAAFAKAEREAERLAHIHWSDIERVAQALLVKKTLTGDDLACLLESKGGDDGRL